MTNKEQCDKAYWKEQRAGRPNAPKCLHNRRPECLPTEDADAYDAIEAEWYQSLQPAFPEERSFVDDIVYNVWMLERLDRTQVELYTFLHHDASHTHPDFPLGQPLAENPKAFNALAWRCIAVRKALRDALDGFKDLRANPLPYQPAPPPPPETIQTASPEIGFEFSTCLESPLAAHATLTSDPPIEPEMTKPKETVEARRWIVSGRVQGVGYRYFAQRAAVELGLNGFARNLPDGSVEVHAAGPPDKLSAFAGILHKGPRWSDVRTVHEEETAVTLYDGFQIR